MPCARRSARPAVPSRSRVYDGARRFDILGHILPKKDASEGALRVELTLRPIAGFKARRATTAIPTARRARSTSWSPMTHG